MKNWKTCSNILFQENPVAATMGSYSGTSEIVEADEDPNTANHSRRVFGSHSGLTVGDKARTRVFDTGNKSYLEDDINQLFESISLRIPSKCSSPLSQTGNATSALRKSAMKKAIAVGMPHSTGIAHPEQVSLKQALRDLCLSKASEMAVAKRLSMSSSSVGVSEAGRIKNLYKSVVVETSRSNLVTGEDKRTMVEISLVPEDCKPCTSKKMPGPSSQSAQSSPRFHAFKSLNQSAHSSPGFQMLKSPNQSVQSSPRFPIFKSTSQSAQTSPRFQTLKSPNQSMSFSPRVAVPKIQTCTEATLTQSDNISTSRNVGTKGLKSPNQSSLPSPKYAAPNIQKSPRTTPKQLEVGSSSRKVGNQVKPSSQSSHTSPRLASPTTRHGGNKSRQVRSPPLKTERATDGKCTLATSKCPSTSIENKVEPVTNAPNSRVAKKTPDPKTSRKAKKQDSSPVSGNRTNKLARSKSKTSMRLVKPVIKHRISVKKKVKQGSAASSYNLKEGNRELVPSTGQLVCQKCQCALSETECTKQGSVTPFSVSHGAEVSSSNVGIGGFDPDVNTSKDNRTIAVVRTNRNSKSKEKGEFSQSSGSMCDFSTSTSNSDESHVSRPSCSNRPHMSKDVRWEAVRHVKRKDGALSLQHFNLIKKLGCGDIGTVYLAELIGSNCLFAIKVMDNEFLARRKKMPRAQTEREILRMLDHPFLPTLYAQFTTDNLSCLVMEYCPGGDLHVLRQKQPGRSFTEPAARFYVAEVLLALEYLHMLGIIYRDLKPENILVREDGHIMLSDFDLSLRCSVSPVLLKSSSDISPPKMSGPCTQSSCIQPFCIEPSCQVPCFAPRFLPSAAKARKLKAELAAQVSLPQLVAEPTDARSNSFVGTHEYLAPEIIKGEGHGAAVDWWTFGIFLYELLYGRTPFKGSGNEETLAHVVLQSLKFPDSPMVSSQARELIKGLLVKEPENRLGTEKGAAEIKQHPFFEGLNWALIRCAIPPESPDMYEYGVSTTPPYDHDQDSRYFEFNAAGEQLEFELF